MKINKTIEECIKIAIKMQKGNVYSSSYAAPREAFRKLLTQSMEKEQPKYIQIVNCGKFEFALWDLPHTHTFYPTHGTQDDCLEWAFENGYELISETDKRIVLRLKD